MYARVDKTNENKSRSVTQKKSKGEQGFGFVDYRPETVAQRKLQEMAKNSPQAMQLRAFQEIANNCPDVKEAAQLQAIVNDHSARQQQPIQKKENNTGLPDNLKAGMENLSGMSLDDVKVHYNSAKPVQLQAHAYAQGMDIHLGPGQEQHLPHEAWHVAQQKQGRLQPTTQLKGDVFVNNDRGLEREADVMGVKALAKDIINADGSQNSNSSIQRKVTNSQPGGAIVQRKIVQDTFPDFVSAQFGLQKKFASDGEDERGVDHYTTVGYEHEFAQLDGETKLQGYTHQEVAKTARKWPIKNEPFLLETDASNALELVSPPYLIETHPDRPVPLANDVQDVDDLTKNFLVELKSISIEEMLLKFVQIDLDFKLDPIVLEVMSWTEGAKVAPGTKLSVEEVNAYKIKESKKGKGGISSQWNIAMDAESMEYMQFGEARAKDPASHKEFEQRLLALARKYIGPEKEGSLLPLFHHQFARSLSGIADVPFIKEQAKRKLEAHQPKVSSGEEEQLPQKGTMAAVDFGTVRNKSSRVKDMNNVWVKEDLVTYAIKVLTDADWSAIAGEPLSNLEGAINESIIPTGLEVPSDAIAYVVSSLKKAIQILNTKAQAIHKKEGDAKTFTKGKAPFLGHSEEVIGARQDTYLPGDATALPGKWAKTPLHVVEVREPDEANLKLLYAVSMGEKAVQSLMEQLQPERLLAEQLMKLKAGIKETMAILKMESMKDAKRLQEDVDRLNLFGDKDPKQLQRVLDLLHEALEEAREQRRKEQKDERARLEEDTSVNAPLIQPQHEATCWDAIAGCLLAIKRACCG